MARIIDTKRAKTPERIENAKKITQKFRTQNPLKWKAECIVNSYIKTLKRK